MRKNIVAGNWKMNKTLQEGVALAKELNEVLASKTPNCDVVVGTPFIHLAAVAATVDTKKIGVAAQNCANKESGAYTGEVSPAMVKSTGAEYVILGHSERREYYNETSAILNDKVALALANGLTPIYCCGEALDIRNADKQNEFVKNQLEETIFNLSAEDFKKLVIAYEPIWAIGTGVTASTEQAQDMLKFIRSIIAEKFGQEIADNTSILYGGSCNAKNAPELFAQPDIDGGLIGGASLKAADFVAIIDAF
jgi:triosephosphate isomerase